MSLFNDKQKTYQKRNLYVKIILETNILETLQGPHILLYCIRKDT